MSSKTTYYSGIYAEPPKNNDDLIPSKGYDYYSLKDYMADSASEHLQCRLNMLVIAEETEKGLAQKDIAKAFNFSEATFSRYLNGERGLSIDDVARIAEHYCVTTDYLMGKTDSNNPNIDEAMFCKQLGINSTTYNALLKIANDRPRASVFNQLFAFKDQFYELLFGIWRLVETQKDIVRLSVLKNLFDDVCAEVGYNPIDFDGNIDNFALKKALNETELRTAEIDKKNALFYGLSRSFESLCKNIISHNLELAAFKSDISKQISDSHDAYYDDIKQALEKQFQMKTN